MKKIRINPAQFAVLALAVSAVALAADTLTVGVDQVDLRSQKSAMFPVVATAKRGDTLTVLQKVDPWMQVQAGDTVGWVRTADLGTSGNSMHSFLSGADAQANGSTAAGSLSEGGAGKGLFPGAEDYAKATGTDPKKLEKLIALRKKLINDGTLARFDQQGKVGVH